MTDASENIVINVVEDLSDTIEQIQSLNDDLKLPVFYKYRYTFEKDLPVIEQKVLAKRIIDFIRERYACDKRLTAGIEHFTKGKLQTRPHLHVHFISKRPSNTIRKGLAQHFEFIGRCQCCKPEPLVNEDKFFKYPLKQQLHDTKVAYWSTFSPNDTTKMVQSAYDLWLVSGEVLVNKLEKKMERTSEDRLFNALDILYQSDPPATYHALMSAALKYYAQNEQTFNYTTINGYVDKYLIQKDLISMSAYFKLKGTPDFTF